MVLTLTALRLWVLFASPLDLYPDEAQYWLWSRTLDFGYYSKPPMVAWSIRATTLVGGDAEAWVRLSSPLYHAGAALALHGVGRKLYGPAAGLAGAALYALMPGVQLSSAIVATDAPLLFFLSLALLAYAHLQNARRAPALAAAFGACLGLAFLSKYAALYALIGLGLHLASSREARAAWDWRCAGAALAAFAVVVAPNLAWNAAHGFATVQHTAANADWRDDARFDVAELADFLGSQFGVFGPIPFAVLAGGAILLTVRSGLKRADILLLCFVLPPLLVVAAQAFISRANANWSAAAYAPASVLAAAWLLRWRARGWLIAALAMQAVLAVAFMLWCMAPSTAERMGVANAFKRSKGWSQMTEQVIDRARSEATQGVSAVAVNNRFLYNAMAYYGRDYFGRPGAPPLKVWLLEAAPQNQAEATEPLTPALGRRVLAVSLEQVYRDRMAGDFARVTGREIISVRLDAKRRRRAELFIGEGFSPRPRPRLSASPTQP